MLPRFNICNIEFSDLQTDLAVLTNYDYCILNCLCVNMTHAIRNYFLIYYSKDIPSDPILVVFKYYLESSKVIRSLNTFVL